MCLWESNSTANELRQMAYTLLNIRSHVKVR
jgi:hypothetical protein